MKDHKPSPLVDQKLALSLFLEDLLREPAVPAAAEPAPEVQSRTEADPGLPDDTPDAEPPRPWPPNRPPPTNARPGPGSRFKSCCSRWRG